MTKIADAGLTPDRNNANSGTQRGRGLLEKSLRKLGAGRSIVADRNGNIIAGNKTLEGAYEIDLPVRIIETDGKELVVVKRTDLDLYSNTDKRARELAYADNKVAELDLAWNTEQIAVDFEPLDLGQWGFEAPEIAGTADAEPQIDRAAELNEKWQVKTGDLFKIGEHRLLCGDSTSVKQIEKLLNKDKVYAVVTDPPYNVGIEFGSGVNDSKTVEENEKFISIWFSVWKDVKIKIVTPGAGYYLGTLKSWLTLFPPTWMCLWLRKNSMSHSPLRGFASWEPVLYYDIEEEQEDWGSVMVYGKVKKPVDQDIFDIPVRVQKDVEDVEDVDGNKLHPTPKPVELFRVLLQKFTSKGDVIAEPFAGSGTTLVACENLLRKCRAIEISPNYCAVILERMATAFPELPIELISNTDG